MVRDRHRDGKEDRLVLQSKETPLTLVDHSVVVFRKDVSDQYMSRALRRTELNVQASKAF